MTIVKVRNTADDEEKTMLLSFDNCFIISSVRESVHC